MKLLAPIVLLVIALATTVWTDDSPSAADLVFVNQNEVFTLDPQRMSYIQDLRLAQALYEGLVRWNNDDFSIVPAVAESFDVDDAGLTYTFRIRPDARWSNGDPVTAHDFAYAWMRAILPDTAADYSTMFFAIDGAKEYFTWRSEQTAAFAANPFDDPESATPQTAKRAIARLQSLLDAKDRPEGIAAPDAKNLGGLRAELAAIEDEAEVGGAALAVELTGASRCRTWHDRLDDRASRRAEAEWMWQRALERFKTVGLEALDNHTLRVRLERPTAYFLDLLCFGVFFPVHRPTVEGWSSDSKGDAPPFEERRWLKLSAASGKVEQRHEWARPEYHVGNGPYVLAQWRYKRDLRLERNPYFHSPQLARSDSMLALTIEDTNTAVLAFESGHVDWLADVSTDYQADMIAERLAYERAHADRIADLRSKGHSLDDILAQLPEPTRGQRRNIHIFPTFGTDFYSFNCREHLSGGQPNPFAHAAVRRAFTMATDKQIIVDRVTRLHERVATTLIPPLSIPGYESPEGLAYDPEAARRELALAGWEDRDGDGFVEDADGEAFPVIDLLYTTNIPRYKWMSLELKAQWETKLGVRVELRPSETKFYKDDLKQGKFMIARGRWYGDYGDPTTFLDLCRENDGNNDRKYASATVEKLLDRAAETTDPAQRMRLLEECEEIICNDAPILPICQLSEVYMYEPGEVRGLSAHPRLTQFLWQMEVVDR